MLSRFGKMRFGRTHHHLKAKAKHFIGIFSIYHTQTYHIRLLLLLLLHCTSYAILYYTDRHMSIACKPARMHTSFLPSFLPSILAYRVCA